MIDSGAQSDAQRRWEAAAKLAEGVSDEGLGRRRRRVLGFTTALVAGSWVVGVALAIVLISADSRASSDGGSTGPSEAGLVGQLVALGLGLVVGVTGLIWGLRSGHYIPRWRAVGSPLDHKEKRSVRRQIGGREPVDRHHLPVIVAAAEQGRRATLGIAPIYAAAMLFAISGAIGTPSVVIRLLQLAVSILFLVAAVALAVAYRRAGTFIEKFGR